MGFLDTVRRWLQREAQDAREVAADAEQRLDAALDKRERELSATPEERLDLTVDDIAAADEEYEALKRTLPVADDPAGDPP